MKEDIKEGIKQTFFGSLFLALLLYGLPTMNRLSHRTGTGFTWWIPAMNFWLPVFWYVAILGCIGWILVGTHFLLQE